MGKLFRKQLINAPIALCWDFFSKPENLSTITPDEMRFEIVESDGQLMHEGQVIRYFVRPFPLIKIQWKSKIINVNEYREFVDIQLRGPYKRWHHRHLFKDLGDKVEMIDAIHYELPFGKLGELLGKKFVAKKLNNIFDFRTKKINEIFPGGSH